ncbi:TIGR02300 family protein [Pseudaminobacter soli (ex Li et al. 2025)]|uniref:TIGR02300 family protein n=1 Tax=Pseudaminobacter soli (ex Li et al. 2025) TaxID=1295366 RepID=A0A2P7S4I5_9HYPH|nr:TIGR02300 family protein [Mesorhizobium soli]PSJ57351.1 TIGR02300 family protein [Mesorhizobium soli]
MAKPELGTKRIDPETGRKFYDLNKDPIVSPYTGKSYPLSFFETTTSSKVVEEEEDEVEERGIDTEEESADIVSLEDADDETKGDEDIISIDDDEDVDLGDDDDTFLEDEEEDNDDVSGIIGVGDDDES